MKQHLLFLYFFFIAACNVSGQIKIIDSLSGETVVGANIYSDQGVLLGISDGEGRIVLDSLKALSTNTIVLQHIAYQNKELNYRDFRSFTTIRLTPRDVEIKEVTITDKSNYDYVVLKGYFRTLDLLNNKSKYFYDGIIEYYIPLKKQEKVRHKLIEYRLFANSESLNEYTRLFGKMLAEPPKLMRIGKESIIINLPKGCTIEQEADRNAVKKDGVNLGFVQHTKTGQTQVYFDRVPPQSIVKRKFLRIQGELYRGLNIENYTKTDLNNPSIESLISKVESDVGAVQRKKKDDYIPMERFSEFYVMERSYMTTDEVAAIEDSFTKSIYLEEKSDYKEKFWLELAPYGIPPLANGISQQIGNELREQK